MYLPNLPVPSYYAEPIHYSNAIIDYNRIQYYVHLWLYFTKCYMAPFNQTERILGTVALAFSAVSKSRSSHVLTIVFFVMCL